MEGDKNYLIQEIINAKNSEIEEKWSIRLSPYLPFLPSDMVYTEKRVLAGDIAFFLRINEEGIARWPKSSEENLLAVVDKIDKVNLAINDGTISLEAPWLMELTMKMSGINSFIEKVKSIVDVADMQRRREAKLEKGRETVRGDELLD